MKIFLKLTFLLVFFNFFASCSDPVSEKYQLLPPETHLSVFSMPGDTIAPGATIKKINWWGDSPNGFVTGYRISFDSLNWGFTTKNDSTFIFTIQGSDSTFRIWVAAVDDKGRVDPTPASNLYPVINSAPTMVFDAGTDLPDTTYPVLTLKWTATDPDGNATIKNFFWSLDDTNNFRPVSGNLSIMTLTKDSGITAGAHRIFMKCIDNAGAQSNIVRMPLDSTKSFYVKPVTGRVLLIKDMPLNELNDLNNYFTQSLDTVKYDVLDIKSYSGKLIPKIVNPMFIETLKLYKVVIWSGNRGGQQTAYDPNFTLAQNSIPFYLAAGGKLLWSSGIPDNFIGQGSLFNFAPVDSIRSSCFIQFNFPGDTLTSTMSGYPDLIANQFIATTRGLYFPPNVSSVYKLKYNPARPYCLDDSFIGIKDINNNPKLILMVMPIYYLNGNTNNSKSFIKKVFTEFGIL